MSNLSKHLSRYQIIDLSHTLEEGMPRPQVPYGHIPWKSHKRGDQFNTFMFLIFEHAGTHVDAPIHLGGVIGPTIDEIPIDESEALTADWPWWERWTARITNLQRTGRMTGVHWRNYVFTTPPTHLQLHFKGKKLQVKTPTFSLKIDSSSR